MDVAKCAQDGNVYIAQKFSLLPAPEIAQKRKYLLCPTCENPAYYKKASCSGQAACFGARPHKEGCDHATSERNRNENGVGEDRDAIKNPGTTIVVDFDFGSAEQSNNDVSDDEHVDYAHGGRFQGNAPRQDAQMHRRPSVLLRNLIDSEQFGISDQILEIQGKGQFLARDFFVNFDAVLPRHDGQYRGYWGEIHSVRKGKAGELWFNPVGRADFGVRLDWAAQFLALNRLQIDDLNKLGGSYILAFGTLSEKNGKQTILVEDQFHLTLKKPV